MTETKTHQSQGILENMVHGWPAPIQLPRFSLKRYTTRHGTHSYIQKTGIGWGFLIFPKLEHQEKKLPSLSFHKYFNHEMQEM